MFPIHASTGNGPLHRLARSVVPHAHDFRAGSDCSFLHQKNTKRGDCSQYNIDEEMEIRLIPPCT
jgi:hypothetical protein